MRPRIIPLLALAAAVAAIGARDYEPRAGRGPVMDTGGQVLNVKAFGAIGDGVTDDTAAIAAAMDQANTSGVPLFFPRLTYYCGPISKSYAQLRVIGNGATIRANTATNVRLWTFSGSAAAPVLLTNSAVTGAISLDLASTAGLAAGDVLQVGDAVANAVNTTRYRGTTVEILAIAGSSVTLKEPLPWPCLVASGGFVAKVTPIRLDMRQLEFTNSGPSTWLGGYLLVNYGRDVVLEDVNGELAGASGISVVDTFGFRIRTRATNYYDEIGDTTGQFGYGVSVVGASAHGQVEVYASRVRHAFTTNGQNNQYGWPRAVHVTGTAHATSSASWDTHGESYGITFENCQAYGSSSAGFALRCPRGRIIGGSAIRCAFGVWAFESAADVEIDGLRIIGTSYLSSNAPFFNSARDGQGILLQTAINGATIKNCYFDEIATSCIRTGTTGVQRILIQNNQFRNYGQAAVSAEKRAIKIITNATDVHIVDNLFESTDSINRAADSTYAIIGGNSAGTRCVAARNIVRDGLTLVDAAAAPYWTVTAGENTQSSLATSPNTTVAATTTTYLAPGSTTAGTVEANRQYILPVGGTLTNLRARFAGTWAADNAVTIIVRVNGADTALTLAANASTSSAHSKADTAHTVQVSAGDLISFSIANAGSTTSGTIVSISCALQ